MVLQVSIDGGLVVVDCTSLEVCHADVVATLKDLGAQPDTYGGKLFLIVDPGSVYMPTVDEVREFAELILPLLGAVFPRIALVVSKTVHLGLGRMAEVFTQVEGGEFRVFLREDEARAWLASRQE